MHVMFVCMHVMFVCMHVMFVCMHAYMLCLYVMLLLDALHLRRQTFRGSSITLNQISSLFPNENLNIQHSTFQMSVIQMEREKVEVYSSNIKVTHTY